MTSPPSLEFLDLQAAIAGRYSLEREIGRGGMGVVFLARDVALERPVAIKLLQRHLAQDPTQRERFLREARTAAQLMHPNIVPIHSVEAHDDLVFFVMAFVDGETLTQRVQRKGLLSGGNATRVMQEVAWALGYAHGRGVIHRDIKPDNILLEHASGRAMVADFGIAQVATRDTLSVDGAFVGTVQYMSPEQADATILDARTDIYSLGATIYFALTGASPVEAPTMPAMLKRLMTDEPPSVGTTRPELQPVLVQAVARALSKDRESRFHSADALASALQEASATVRAVRPEVRAFLREVTAAQVVLTAGLGTLVFGAAYSGGTYYGGGVFRQMSAVFLSAMVLGTGALALFVASTAGAIGALRRDAVPWDDVEAALTREVGELEDQKRLFASRGLGEKRDRKILQVIGSLIAGVGGIGLARLWIDPNVQHSAFDTGLAIGFELVGLLLIIAGRSRMLPSKWFVSKRVWSPEALTLQLLRFVMHRGPLAHYYARGAAAPPHHAPSALPTATLLLQRVEELVAQLPDTMRARLRDVLPVAQGLEHAIALLRNRVEQIDRAIAELPASSVARMEFNAARDSTAARLADCVSALEQVRTDLLRLGAGLIAADGITAELEKAHELSAAVDAELTGIDQVQQIVGGN